MQHARTPDQTFEDYRRKKYEELEYFIAKRKTVYLDMNFWIYLRDPENAPNPSKSRQLLELLRNGVANGQFLCPVSYEVLKELWKQNPRSKRLAQAIVMDELSKGVGIRNPFDTATIEYAKFFKSHLTDMKCVPFDPIWAPIGHLIGEFDPSVDSLPHALQERGRKVMLDYSWTLKIADFAETEGFPIQIQNTAAKSLSQ